MKKEKNREGVVYSTDPDFEYQYDAPEEPETLAPNQQNLRVQLDKKARAGKKVTLITGFVGKQDDLVELSKRLKTLCGVGGSAKDSEIILQGDFRPKVAQFLENEGYKVKTI